LEKLHMEIIEMSGFLSRPTAAAKDPGFFTLKRVVKKRKGGGRETGRKMRGRT